MGAVADFVEDVGGGAVDIVSDVVGGAVDVVGDVVETVGDVGQDVIDVASDAVQTVGDTVSGVVEGALADPIGTAALVATAVTAPALLPVVSAGNVIANGGDIGDALLAAGATYAGQAVASTLNSQLGTALDYGTDVGSQQTSMLAAQDAGLFPTNPVVAPIGNAAGVTTAGVVQGQDLGSALERGLISGAGNLVGQEVGMQTGSPAAANIAGAVTAGALAGQDVNQIFSNALVNNLIDQGIGAVRDTINAPAVDTASSFDPDRPTSDQVFGNQTTTTADASGFSPEELAAINAGAQDAQSAQYFAPIASGSNVASDASTNTPLVPQDNQPIDWNAVPNIEISGVGVTPEDQITPPTPEQSFLDKIGGVLGLGTPDQTADYVSLLGSGATSNSPITSNVGLVGTGTAPETITAVAPTPVDIVPTPTQPTPAAVDLTPINNQITGLQSGLNQLSQTQQSQYDQLSSANKSLYDQMVAQGATQSEALNAAMANQSQALNNVQSNLTQQIGGVQSGLEQLSQTQQSQYDQLSSANKSLFDQMVAQGASQSEALNTAMANQSQALGNVQSNLTQQINQLGQTQQTQYNQLSDANKNLYNQMIAQGASQSEALNTAMASQSQALQGVRADLAGEIGNVQSNLTGQIGQLGQQTQQQFANLTAAQQAEVQARIAQGQDLQSAIGAVQSNLSGQLGEVQSGLSTLGNQIGAGTAATTGAIGQLGSDLTTQNQALREAIATGNQSLIGAVQGGNQGVIDALNAGNVSLASAIASGNTATTGAIGQLGSDLTTQNQALQNAIATGNSNIVSAVQGGNQGVINALTSGNTALAAALASTLAATTSGFGGLSRQFSGLTSALTAGQRKPIEDLGATVVKGNAAELASIDPFANVQQAAAPQNQNKAEDLFFNEEDIYNAKEGGLIEHQPEFFSEGGLGSLENRYVKGDGDGTSDSIPAMLATGEFVIPADVVSGLGNGDNEAGAQVLDHFMMAIRKHKRAADPSELPEDSKGPLEYLKEATRKVRK